MYRLPSPALLEKYASTEDVAAHINFVFGLKTENYSVNLSYLIKYAQTIFRLLLTQEY